MNISFTNRKNLLPLKTAKSFKFIVIILLLASHETTIIEARDISDTKYNISSNEIVVKFSQEAPSRSIRKTINQSDSKVVREIPEIGATILKIQEGNIEDTLNFFYEQENVIYAEPNYLAEITDIFPNDPYWSNQYNLAAIHAPQGWAMDTGAVWVTIAIIDTGVDLSHPDLFVRILPGYDFVNNDSTPQDDNGHGTHVAAIAAASSNNAVGISGVNWGANILPIKVLNASGNGTYANVAAGIVWATNHGAQVINLSLGGASSSFVLSDAVNYAYNHGVTLIASTGNAGAPAVLYPAAFDAVIAVGATDISNSWASFSNYGPEVDVVAPGVNIYSAYIGGGYGYRSGTSMSAPHVSGLAAILWGIPGNNPTRVRTLIESTSQDLGAPGWDEYFGFGLIQMDTAILSALPVVTETPATDLIEKLQEAPPPYRADSALPSLTFTSTSSILTTEKNASLTLTPTSSMIEANQDYTPTPTSDVDLVNHQNDDFGMLCGALILLVAGGVLLWLGTNWKNRYKTWKIRI